MNHFYIVFVFIILNTLCAFAGPSRTTYQAKIIKPDGYPLEASIVNFKFTILDPVGSCILYAETYSNVNMGSSAGLVSFSLGSGVRTFPVSGSTFEQVFSNTTASLPCDAGGLGTYSPLATDTRRVVMQFNDGNGWQTLPAMTINAVPYAMYANDSLKFSGKDITDFVQVASLPTCSASEAVRFNGAGFSCVAVGNPDVSVTSSSVIAALGYTPADGADVTSTLSSVSSTVFSVSSAVTSLQNSVAASFATITNSQWITSGTSISHSSGNVGIGTSDPQRRFVVRLDDNGTMTNSAFYNADTTNNNAVVLSLRTSTTGSSAVAFHQAAGISAIITEHNHSTRNANLGFYTDSASSPSALRMNITGTGNVGIGLTNPITKLDVAGGIRLGTEAATCSAGYAGTLRYSSSTVEYCNGSAWITFGVSGAGILAINSLTSGSQTFAMGTSGVAPNVSSTGTVHTFNFPFASTATTTAGLISYNDYLNFSNKQSATSAAVVATLGYTPANAVSVTTLSSTVSSLSATAAASFAAITSSQWIASGSAIHYLSGNVGIGTSSPAQKLQVQDGKITATGAGGFFQVGTDTSDSNLGKISFHGNNTNTTNQHWAGLAYSNGGGWMSLGGGTSLNLFLDSGSGSGYGSHIFRKVGWDGSNRVLTEQMRLDYLGNLGLGVTNPTAKLHLSAGTSVTAALRFTASTLTASAQTGAMEYDGANFYLTDGSNNRRAIATGSSSGSIDNASIINSTGNISMVPLGSVIVSSTTPSTSPSNGALIVKGGAGIAGDINVGGSISGGNTGQINFTGNLGDGSGGMRFQSVGSVDVAIDTDNNDTIRQFRVMTNGSDRASATTLLAVTEAGNVGIGTTAPTVALDVVGTYRISATASSAAYVEIGNMNYGSLNPGISTSNGGYIQSPLNGSLVVDLKNNQIDDAFAIRYSASNTGIVDSIGMVLNGQGRMGIGTSSPTRILEVVQSDTPVELSAFMNSNSASSPTDGALVRIHNTSPASNKTLLRLGKRNSIDTGFNYGDFRLNNTGDIEFAVGTGSGNLIVPEMVLSSGGNLGIGTSAPATRLHIVDNVANILLLERTNNQNSLIEYKNTLGSVFAGQVNGTADWGVGTGLDLGATGVFRVANSGRVYIGGTITPTARLHITPGTSSVAPLKLGLGVLLTSPQSGTIEYDGSSYYVTDNSGIRRTIATATTAGVLTNTNTVSSTSGIVLWPASGNSVTVSSTVASTNSSTGALIVNGGAGIAGNLNVGGAISGSSTIKATGFRANQGAPDAGDSSTVGYAFGADGDTGIFSPGSGSANGQLSFYSNNGERMRMTASGALGIGQIPTAQLHVFENTTLGTGFGSYDLNNAVLRVQEASGNGLFADGNTILSDVAGGFSIGTIQGQPILFGTSNTERMRVDANGNLGIATTAAISRLDVNYPGSTPNATNSDANNFINKSGFRVAADFGAGSNALYFGVSELSNTRTSWIQSGHRDPAFAANATDSELVLQPHGGNVGIGTSSPQSKLQVYNSLSGGNANETIRSQGKWGSVGDGSLIRFTNQHNSGDTPNAGEYNLAGIAAVDDLGLWGGALYFKVAPNGNTGGSNLVDAMVIKSSGNVGIGTVAPASILSVEQNVNSDTFVNATNNSSGTLSRAGFVMTNSGSAYGPYSAGMLLAGVSHSTTPNQIALFSNSGIVSGINISASTGGIRFSTGATERMRVDGTTGNIGIGTTTPAAQLHIGKQEASPGTSGSITRMAIQPYGHTGGPWKIDARDLGADAFLDFYYGAGPVMTFENNGNIGVGTITPLQKLHVSGNVQVNGDIYGGLYGGTRAIWRFSTSDPNFGIFYTEASPDRISFSPNGGGSATPAMVVHGNNVGIGVSAPVYQLQLSTDSAAKPGTSTWTVASDERLKDIRAPFTRGIAALNGLNTVYFNYKQDNPLGLPSSKEFVGIKAQDVLKVIPEAVAQDAEGFFHVTNDSIIWTAVNAIKEIYHKLIGVEGEVKNLKVENAIKDRKIQSLEQENAAIKAYLCSKDPAAPLCQ